MGGRANHRFYHPSIHIRSNKPAQDGDADRWRMRDAGVARFSL